MKRSLIPLSLVLAALPFAAASLFADDAKPAKPAPKEEKPADNEASLDDLLKLPTEKKPDDAPKPAPGKLDDDAKRLTGNESVDTILKAIGEMEEAGQRLSVRQDPGLETQRIQESILKRLDQAIAAAKQQQQQQQQQQQGSSQQQKQENGSQQNQPQNKQANQQQKQPGDKQPGSNPEQDKVSKDQVDPHELGGPLEETRIEWGSLPARIRGELDQGLAEKFSPLYKKLTEAYYRRLAEEGKD